MRVLIVDDDPITTKRVYKEASSHDVARSIILRQRGAHFNPDIVDRFLANEQEFITILKRFAETDSSVGVPSHVQPKLVV